LTLKFTRIFTAQTAKNRMCRQIYAIKFNKLKFDQLDKPSRAHQKELYKPRETQI